MGSASRAVSCLCCPCKCLACGLFSCLCSILVSVIVTAGVLALILYFIFRPQMITATADSAALSQFSLSPASTLTYDLAVNLTLHNPNTRVGLYYDSVESLAFYKDQRFGYDPLDSFYQGTKASTQLAADFRGQQLLQGDVTAAEFRQEQTDGNFAINVDLNAKLRVKVWAFKVRGPNAKVTCKLSVPAPGATNASPFQPTDCKVGF
ncbi:hypothetical protein BS78_06G290700 [Paspalum vaginatum]|nr:hypothetical protein BS78_06G290700 [Paspalum vaginatum]